MQINKLIDGLSVLKEGKQNNADLLDLSARISRLYTGYMGDNMEGQDVAVAKEIFADNALMDTADTITFTDSDADKLQQIKTFAAQKMSNTFIKETGNFISLDNGINESTALGLAGTLFIILEKENSKNDVENLTNRIFECRFGKKERTKRFRP